MSVEPPLGMQLGVSDRDAPKLCRDWMVYLGAADTVQAVADSAKVCDLYSGNYLGWVDNSRGNLDPELVLKAASVARTDGRLALIFVSGGITTEAQRRADEAGVALFRYDAVDGLLAGGNELGYFLRSTRLK